MSTIIKPVKFPAQLIAPVDRVSPIPLLKVYFIAISYPIMLTGILKNPHREQAIVRLNYDFQCKARIKYTKASRVTALHSKEAF
jgi:hypothetical protein